MSVPQRRRPHRRWSSEDSDLRVIDPGRNRRARADLKISQRKLARRCECTQSMISLIETGKLRSLSEKLALVMAEELRKPWEHLFTDEVVTLMPAVTNAVHADLQASA